MRWYTIWLIHSRSFAGDRGSKVKWGVQAHCILAKLSFDEEGDDEGEVTSSKPGFFLVSFLMVDDGGSIFQLRYELCIKSQIETDMNELNSGLCSEAGESE